MRQGSACKTFVRAHPDMSENARQLQEFVQLLTSSQSRIRAFVVALMPGNPDIGDVIQETNLKLWLSRARFRPGSNFVAWAFAIARLEVLHYRSRNKRWERPRLSVELQAALAAEAMVTGDHEDYLRALETCVSGLPPQQRELIRHRYEAGQSLEEYARVTGRKASALRVALMRVRGALRECIERSLPGQCPA